MFHLLPEDGKHDEYFGGMKCQFGLFCVGHEELLISLKISFIPFQTVSKNRLPDEINLPRENVKAFKGEFKGFL